MSLIAGSMAIDFADVLTQTVAVRNPTTKNGDGSQNFSTASVSYNARVVNANKQTRDLQGDIVQAAYVAWIASTGVLSPQARYQLPDGTTPPVLNLNVYPDENGNYFNRITFGN